MMRHMKELLPLDSSEDTRLETVLHQLNPEEVNPPIYDEGHWVLYIRVFDRHPGETVLSNW